MSFSDAIHGECKSAANSAKRLYAKSRKPDRLILHAKGECWDLAWEAIRKKKGYLPKTDGTDDELYIWSNTWFDLKDLTQLTTTGLILQHRDFILKRSLSWKVKEVSFPDGSTYKAAAGPNKSQVQFGIPRHTAIFSKVENKTDLVVIEQNVFGIKKAKINTHKYFKEGTYSISPKEAHEYNITKDEDFWKSARDFKLKVSWEGTIRAYTPTMLTTSAKTTTLNSTLDYPLDNIHEFTPNKHSLIS